jgi:glycosyltransferase involved in cell wall biosynthesis
VTPPPVNGMSLFTKKVVDLLSPHLETQLINLSFGQYTLKRSTRLIKKLLLFLTAIPKIILQPKRNIDYIYIPLDARLGLYYSLVFVLLARLRKYRIILHHHVYNYINKYDIRVAILNRLIGKGGTHIVHCNQMKQDYIRTYTIKNNFIILPPTVIQKDSLYPRSLKRNKKFTIGLLSNLTPEKGVVLALKTFDLLLESGRDVRMILAGPIINKRINVIVNKFIIKWPDRFEYRGFVYGIKKSQFFFDIDIFLFPTLYEAESWGIVLEEALNAGCPVITTRRGCIPWVVRDGCGIIVQPWQSYSDIAIKHICNWMDDYKIYREYRENALNRAKSLKIEANFKVSFFLQSLLSNK